MEKYTKLLILFNLLELISIWVIAYDIRKLFRNEFRHNRNINKLQARNIAMIIADKSARITREVENSEKRIRKEMNK